MRLVWVADQGCGGFGDRLVGLVSAFFIAKASNREFLICWRYPDMSSCFVIRPKYLYNDIDGAKERRKYFNWIDKRADLRHFLNAEQLNQGIFKDCDTVFLSCNQFLCPFLNSKPSLQDIRNCYQSIFTEFFELTPRIVQKLHEFKREVKWDEENNRRKMAFQVRLGDHQIRRFQHPYQAPNPEGLEAILKQLAGKLEGSKMIYFSSDCDADLCLPILKQYVGKETKVVACQLPVEHIDRTRNCTRDGQDKLLIDFFMMASCDTFLIPWHSNLSRTAILHNQIPRLEGIIYSLALVTSNRLSLFFDRISGGDGEELLYCKGLKSNVRIN